VLDLSANELSETGVCVLAEATRNAPGLRQLRLLGNKIPFGLPTLRKLMEVGWCTDVLSLCSLKAVCAATEACVGLLDYWATRLRLACPRCAS
jgi:hypothetical protein